MKEKYYIIPTNHIGFGSVEAESSEEALETFLNSINFDMTEILMATKDYPRHTGLHSYCDPKNRFEILITCIVESLSNDPHPLYDINLTNKKLSAQDANMLIHIQMAYEYAIQNPEINKHIISLLYRKATTNSLSFRINESLVPRIALKVEDWTENRKCQYYLS
ncbi:MAG: hypothetical protein HFI44_16155 [Lachnospiraceae bacterium]|jgi:hypothetical protein|nr:hypothetical protein [Lachnospiraceae bacterium]